MHGNTISPSTENDVVVVVSLVHNSVLGSWIHHPHQVVNTTACQCDGSHCLRLLAHGRESL